MGRETPSNEIQRSQVREYLNQPLEKDKRWCLISKHWFDSWKDYVNYDRPSEANSELEDSQPVQSSDSISDSSHRKSSDKTRHKERKKEKKEKKAHRPSEDNSKIPETPERHRNVKKTPNTNQEEGVDPKKKDKEDKGEEKDEKDKDEEKDEKDKGEEKDEKDKGEEEKDEEKREEKKGEAMKTPKNHAQNNNQENHDEEIIREDNHVDKNETNFAKKGKKQKKDKKPKKSDSTADVLKTSPGAIDNRWLIVADETSSEESDSDSQDDSTDQFTPLMPSLEEGQDFELVPYNVWELFVKWWGGGPAIIRKVVGVPDKTGERLLVEIYPMRLYVYKTLVTGAPDARSRTKISPVSQYMPLEEFKTLVCGELQIDKSKVRLWNLAESSLIKEEPKLSLQDVAIANEGKILFEVKTTAGWPRDKKTNKTTSSSKPQSLASKISSKFVNRVASFFLQQDAAVVGQPSSPKPVMGQIERPEAWLVGLKNLGNTCYMNSALQCLLHTGPFVEYFLSGKFKWEINKTNTMGMKGKIAVEFAALAKEFFSGTNSAISPRDFKSVISKYASQFQGFGQHDAQELLSAILDGLNEDLNRVPKKPYFELKSSNYRPDEEVAIEHWNGYLSRNNSVVVDLFQGQFKSKLVCPTCEHVSITFDPFVYLSLPLPGANKAKDIPVTLIRYNLDPWTPPEEFLFSLPKNKTFSDIRQGIADSSNIPRDRIALADIYLGRIHAYLRDDKSIASFGPKDVTFAYQVPNNFSEKGVIRVEFVNRRPKKINDKLSTNSYELFGYPWMVFIEENKVTNHEIYEIVMKKLSKFVPSKWKASEKNPYPFVLKYVMKVGTTCSKCSASSCKGCVVEDNDKKYKAVSGSLSVAVEWETKLISKSTLDVNAMLQVTTMYEKKKEEKRSKNATLNDCLRLFTNPEKLSKDDPWYCPKCQKHREATKSLEIWKAPEILIVHLKQFSYTRTSREKLNIPIDFPLSNLDLTEHVLDPKSPKSRYNLFAVSVHSGSLSGGHYTAFCKAQRSKTEKWYGFNDSIVRSASEEDVKGCSAYMLFYQREK